MEVLIKLAYFVEPAGHANGKIKGRVFAGRFTEGIVARAGVGVDRGLRLIPGLKSYDLASRSIATVEYDPEICPPNSGTIFLRSGRTLQRNGGPEHLSGVCDNPGTGKSPDDGRAQPRGRISFDACLRWAPREIGMGGSFVPISGLPKPGSSRALVTGSWKIITDSIVSGSMASFGINFRESL